MSTVLRSIELRIALPEVQRKRTRSGQAPRVSIDFPAVILCNIFECLDLETLARLLCASRVIRLVAFQALDSIQRYGSVRISSTINVTSISNLVRTFPWITSTTIKLLFKDPRTTFRVYIQDRSSYRGDTRNVYQLTEEFLDIKTHHHPNLNNPYAMDHWAKYARNHAKHYAGLAGPWTEWQLFLAPVDHLPRIIEIFHSAFANVLPVRDYGDCTSCKAWNRDRIFWNYREVKIGRYKCRSCKRKLCAGHVLRSKSSTPVKEGLRMITVMHKCANCHALIENKTKTKPYK